MDYSLAALVRDVIEYTPRTEVRFKGVMYQSDPVRWYRLICAAEAFREHTGLGIPYVWKFIHAGDYEGANRALRGAVGRHLSHMAVAR